MRLRILFAILLFLQLAPVHAQAQDFNGAWVAWLCPNGTQRESGKCSNFVLELHQKDDKLCGAHLFSSAGAARIDEGAASSVVGDITGETATVQIISGRVPTVRVRAEMKLMNGVLHWQRLENPSGDYLLPMQTRLTKSKSKTLFAPVFEHELKAACLSVFTMATENAKSKPTDAKPADAAAKH